MGFQFNNNKLTFLFSRLTRCHCYVCVVFFLYFRFFFILLLATIPLGVQLLYSCGDVEGVPLVLFYCVVAGLLVIGLVAVVHFQGDWTGGNVALAD